MSAKGVIIAKINKALGTVGLAPMPVDVLVGLTLIDLTRLYDRWVSPVVGSLHFASIDKDKRRS
jgi:hypothetical protein